MIVDKLKARVTQAMKEGDALAKGVLRLALGEIQTAEARQNRALSDEEATQIVRKLIKSNEETMGLAETAEAKQALASEIAVLRGLLPASLDVDAIVAALAPVADAVRAAKAEGQAMGVAMKHLKAGGLAVEAQDVSQAVKRLRG